MSTSKQRAPLKLKPRTPEQAAARLEAADKWTEDPAQAAAAALEPAAPPPPATPEPAPAAPPAEVTPAPAPARKTAAKAKRAPAVPTPAPGPETAPVAAPAPAAEPKDPIESLSTAEDPWMRKPDEGDDQLNVRITPRLKVLLKFLGANYDDSLKGFVERTLRAAAIEELGRRRAKPSKK